MTENYLIIKSVRNASSLRRYRIRLMKDTCLHDDVHDFLSRRQETTSQLVDRLVNGDFLKARFTDPTYPA